MFFLSKKTKKISITALLVVVISVYAFGFGLFRPTPTYAQFVDVNQGVRNVTDNIGDSLLAAGLGALVNGVSYFMRKIAYDTAKYVASGGKGQSALVFQDGFGSYLTKVGADSAFDALEQFGQPFGLNICKPPDLRIQIGLQVNISNIYKNEFGGPDGTGGPQPSCTYNQFKQNWDNAKDTLVSDQSLLEKFNTSLKTSQGDLGVALNLLGKVDSIVAQQQITSQLDRLEGQGFKPVTDLISGDVRTPAQIIAEETKGQLTASNQTKLNTSQIAGIYGAGAIQVLPMALSVFANTLVNSLLQNVLEKGLFPSKSGDASSVADFYASNINTNRQNAEQAFSYLIAGIPQRPLTAYDVVTEYSTCSDNPGLNNCVMDSGLVQALDRARVDSALTIEEAIKQNLLHENWPLIAPSREVDNTNLQYCHSSAYCVSNVEKLRKARILPLGFEIAVRNSPPDKPWTLGEVVRGFDKCGQGEPFCKLIDPNWILKAPEARCEAKVFGPELLTESAPTRREECVDFSTCLQTDASGQCIGYGYCTQEENVWKMPGNSCPEQFNTCKTYVSASSGKIASYLSRTIDTQSCTADSVGCRAYSLDKVGDKWVSSDAVDTSLTFSGRTQAIHLTTAEQCPASAEGCNLFVDPRNANSDSGKILMKKAPDYLGCYDVDPATPKTIEWPQTEAELTKLNTQKAAACSSFAGACIPNEVGCQEYRPSSGGTSVTGIIGGNSCPSQCVGYETFKQESTNFESSKFPLNFIARNARTCAIQDVGCDEFTNLNTASRGGEALEYYTALKRCEIPTGTNSKAFYSWEGSESQGYILRRHTLAFVSASESSYVTSLGLSYKSGDSAATVFGQGSPAYVDDTKAAMQSNYDQCNQEAYNRLLENAYDPKAANPDCRAFYDSDGKVYYRLLKYTVTVSNACTPLRKTNSEMVVDPNINAQNGGITTCEAKGGVWQGGVCKRCSAGGQYEINPNINVTSTIVSSGTPNDSSHAQTSGGTDSNIGIGSCVYYSIRSEASSCTQSANGCRSYIGNTGNNVYTTASFSFEPSGTSPDALNNARAGWGGAVSIESESLQVGQHSLRVNGSNTSYTFESGRLKPGAWYELRFWARGNSSFGLTSGFSQNGQNIGQAFTFNPLINSSVPASVATEWREYRVGPVQFTGDATKAAQLYFGGQATTIPGTAASYSTTLTGAAGTSQTTESYKLIYGGKEYIEGRYYLAFNYCVPGSFSNCKSDEKINVIKQFLNITTAAATTIYNNPQNYSYTVTLPINGTSFSHTANGGSQIVMVDVDASVAEYDTFRNLANDAGVAGQVVFFYSNAFYQTVSQQLSKIITTMSQISGISTAQLGTQPFFNLGSQDIFQTQNFTIKDNIATLSEAQQMVNSMIAAGARASVQTTQGTQTDSTSVVNALVSLGFSQQQAQSMVNTVLGGNTAGIRSNISLAEAQNIQNKITQAGGQVSIQQISAAQPPIAANQFYFLDNVELVQIGGQSSDHEYLIKNSWRTPEGYEVPLACDATPNDGLPGQYLGCREYTRTDGQKFTLTNFERLCRAEAVGCTAVVDTQNTYTGARSEDKQAYGVVCRKSGVVSTPTLCSVTLTESTTVATTYSCTVAKGTRECRIKSPIVIPAGATETTLAIASFAQTPGKCISINNSCALNDNDKLFVDGSTVVTKADSGLIYLTQRQQFLCQQQNLGCTKAALETKNFTGTGSGAYSYQDTFIKADPNKYSETLCSGNQVGCEAYKQDSSLVYFKDPKVAGNSMCIYKENITKDAGSQGPQTYSGWFKDTGTCSVTGNECRVDSDCGSGSKCNNVGTTPCYSDYLDSNNEYGLWSQGTSKYAGFVGMCDAANNGCTELVDRAAITSSTPKGKSYFVLMNDRLTANVSQCAGKVSQKEGCVLFDMTENPNKIFNTDNSYADSEAATPPNSLVLPSEAGVKDSNIILKVDRDRQCREWLACKSSITVYDQNGKPSSLCQQYATCNKLDSSGNCTADGWVNSNQDNTRLTQEKYVSRPTKWNSPEYSGYSLYGAFNPSNYVYLLFPSSTNAYLAYEMSPTFFLRDPISPSTDFEEKGCRVVDPNNQNKYVKLDGDVCGFDNGGRCYSQRCLYPINSNFIFTARQGSGTETTEQATVRSKANVADMLKELQPGICKSYAEKDSPFNINVAIKDSTIGIDTKTDVDNTGVIRVEYSQKKANFEQANVCQPGDKSKDCSCEYIKLEYKNGTTDYWPIDSKLPNGICSGDSKFEGRPCTVDSQCQDAGSAGGKCNLVQKKTTSYGQRGLCLEYDRSRPIGLNNTSNLFEAFQCLTWLPIQVSASAININDLSQGAGYNPGLDAEGRGGETYCTESTNRGAGYYNAQFVEYSAIFSGGLTGKGQINDLVVFNDGAGSGSQVTYYHDIFKSDTNYSADIPQNNSEFSEMMALDELNGIVDSSGNLQYTMMQAWAWKNIGQSARILRLDAQGGTRDDGIFPPYLTDVDTGSSIKKATVNSFAPNIRYMYQNKSASKGDTGVLMHPPLWSVAGVGYMNPANNSNIHSDILSANTDAFLRGGYGSNPLQLIDSGVETNLKEKDIKSVYFIPIAHIDGGSRGPNPSVLSKGMSINFNSLRNGFANGGKPGRISVSSVNDKNNLAGYSNNNALWAVSYLLKRDQNSSAPCEGRLVSYCDYSMGWNNAYTQNISQDAIDKSEIASRYVMLVFKGSVGNYQSQFYGGVENADQLSLATFANNIASQGQDPFSITCDNKANNNWLAIGMDFNKDGEFLGYISRWCQGDGSGVNGIRMATIAEFNDRCVEFTPVVNDVNGIDESKAWTDRVWQSSQYVSSDSLLSKIKRTGEITPFGSLAGITRSVLQNTPLDEPTYQFPDYTQGVPYRCRGGDGFSTGQVAHIFDDSVSCLNDADVNISNAVSNQGSKIGTDILRELFLKFWERKNIVTQTSGAVDDTKSGDPSFIANSGTKPPQVFALNPYTCSQQGATCTPGEPNAFTINARNYTLADYNGDQIPDEDKSLPQGVDPIIQEKSYTAVVDFFAVVDDNRMPIKRIKVDWRDGTPINNNKGLSKNYKPYCATGDDNSSLNNIGRCSGTQITCKESADCAFVGGACEKEANIKFGDASRACDAHYFETSHTYVCSGAEDSSILVKVGTLQSSDPEAYKQLIERGLGNDSKVCTYTPGVQVLDNWGWCNASDANRQPISGGAYNDNSLKRCDNLDGTANVYTFYKGKIIVIP